MAPSASLDGRIAIVTGGGRGLGRVMALALARAGADVVVSGARRRDELEETVSEAAELGRGRCASILADVSDETECREVARFATLRFGPASILVNNAARGPAEQSPDYRPDARPRFWESDAQALRRMLLTNVAGPWMMAAAVVPDMIAAGFGRIVNISTSRPTMLFAGGGCYGPSKTALEASSRIWATELAGTGVTVNVLLPGGASDTALIPGDAVGSRAAAFVAGKDVPGKEGFVDGLLPPAIMAPPLVWLASDASSGVTGRRFVARDWDADLPPADAAARAEAAAVDWPHII